MSISTKIAKDVQIGDRIAVDDSVFVVKNKFVDNKTNEVKLEFVNNQLLYTVKFHEVLLCK